MDGKNSKSQHRLSLDCQGSQVSAVYDPVVPLAPATVRRIMDTWGRLYPARSSAVSLLNNRQGDVDRTNNGATRTTRTMPTRSTSTMATRTTGTSTTTISVSLSAAHGHPCHADFSFDELVQAYIDCRKRKRNTTTALAFEQYQEDNLLRLYEALQSGTYYPGRSICFVITRPKPREVWAALFEDRIVHHLFYNRVKDRFHNAFIADTCACIPGRGTLYGARRLEKKIRSITQNWSRPAYYLKFDLANFFVSVNKQILFDILQHRIYEPWLRALAETIVFHDPRENVDIQSPPDKLALIPPHKSLFNQVANKGLPIGNLSSQFFANVHLNELDQFIKHQLRARYYIRYVDDCIILHESPQQLNAWLADIEAFLLSVLDMQINPKKTILQPIERGVDFVGQVIKPWRTIVRRRTFNDAVARIRMMPPEDVYESANSYFGLFRQATHSFSDRSKLARIIMKRGHSVNYKFTKTYERRNRKC